MKTNLKTFLEGKEDKFISIWAKDDDLTYRHTKTFEIIFDFLSQTAKEAYELGKKEGWDSGFVTGVELPYKGTMSTIDSKRKSK